MKLKHTMVKDKKHNILYVFGGEKAQGAEIVIERLMQANTANANCHLLLSPGNFADKLLAERKPYRITTNVYLKKLNRGGTSSLKFYARAIKNYLAISSHVYRYIKANDIQVVHANTVVPASYLLPLIWVSRIFLSNVKWIWSDHDISYFSRIDHILSSWCARSYDRTLVVSSAVMQKYHEIGKLRVLYNGLDTNLFRKDNAVRDNFRAQFAIAEKQIVIGMPAVVTPRKGQLELINVVQRLSKAYPQLILLLSGGYEATTREYGEHVKEAIAKNENVRHLGYVTDMQAFYNGCDVVVSNSDLKGSEPLGTTIYESMACEKIVLASNTGGSKEIITDQTDGILFKPENEFSLEHSIRSVLTWPKHKLAKIRRAARNKAETKFNILGMVEHYNLIIKQID